MYVAVIVLWMCGMNACIANTVAISGLKTRGECHAVVAEMRRRYPVVGQPTCLRTRQ